MSTDAENIQEISNVNNVDFFNEKKRKLITLLTSKEFKKFIENTDFPIIKKYNKYLDELIFIAEIVSKLEQWGWFFDSYKMYKWRIKFRLKEIEKLYLEMKKLDLIPPDFPKEISNEESLEEKTDK